MGGGWKEPIFCKVTQHVLTKERPVSVIKLPPQYHWQCDLDFHRVSKVRSGTDRNRNNLLAPAVTVNARYILKSIDWRATILP